MRKKRAQSCEVCNASVSELRRGRCWGCYHKWVSTRPVGLGALCCMCGDRRRELLKSVELLGSWVPICHNCSALAGSLDPMPQSIGDIRECLSRDRRENQRRWGKRDLRVFRYNRRGQERRLDREPVEDRIDEDMIVEISELVSDLDLLSLQSQDKSQAELTCIRQRPNLSE